MLLFLFSVIRAETHKMPLRIANREDPDQTASEEAVWPGSALFAYSFFNETTSIRKFRTFTVTVKVHCWILNELDHFKKTEN